ncbi:hypothetical protein [Nocardia sp. NPDC051570]|uniref:hypothetical protein n=1 Tax=Nocardia sp. NPDC051570 TaxID=3364324 RepID=UPI00379DAC51
MAKTRKVTVTVPEQVADTLSKWAESGDIDSVSAYVAESVQQRMNRDESLRRLAAAFGGPPPAEMVADVLRKLGRPDLINGAA